MYYVNIFTAITLTGWSERTFWRRFADGSVIRGEKSGAKGKAMVLITSLTEHFCIPISSDDLALIESADNGDAQAQTDLALIFHANRKFKECVFWLQSAAKADYAPAMRWLGICHFNGEGLPPDDNLGIMWLARAAASGDRIALAQMQAMRTKLSTPSITT